MQNNPHYLALMRQARADHLANIRNVSGEIADLYTDAARDLAKQAAGARKGSLSQRWAAEYSGSLKRRADELRAGLYETTYQGLKRSANLPAAAMGNFWYAVGGQSFRDAFASPPDDVLTQIISGGFYKDNKGLSDRIWRIADDFEKDIDYIINRGIAEHKSAYRLAKDLEQYVKDPARRDFDWGKVYPNLRGKKVDFNAQRLARTSINHSYFLSNQKVCRRNPYVTAMHWELSPEHDERQVKPFGPDECDDYAAHEEGLGAGNFKPEGIPTPHPQCLCAQCGVIPQSLEEIGAEIGDWISGAPNEKLDAWYETYGQNFDKSSLQNAADGGRMNTDSGTVYHAVTKDSIARVPQIDISDDEGFNERYRGACRDLLRAVMASETEPGTEFSAVYDRGMNRIGEYRRGNVGHVKIDNPDELYHALHNHGSGETLSFTDIRNMLNRENQMSITAVGNNGSIYGLFISADGDRDGYSNYLSNKAEKIIYSANGIDFSLNIVEQIAKGQSKIPELSEQQERELQAVVIKSTEELLKDGEKYGFQYFQ